MDEKTRPNCVDPKELHDQSDCSGDDDVFLDGVCPGDGVESRDGLLDAEPPLTPMLKKSCHLPSSLLSSKSGDGSPKSGDGSPARRSAGPEGGTGDLPMVVDAVPDRPKDDGDGGSSDGENELTDDEDEAVPPSSDGEEGSRAMSIEPEEAILGSRGGGDGGRRGDGKTGDGDGPMVAVEPVVDVNPAVNVNPVVNLNGKTSSLDVMAVDEDRPEDGAYSAMSVDEGQPAGGAGLKEGFRAIQEGGREKGDGANEATIDADSSVHREAPFEPRRSSRLAPANHDLSLKIISPRRPSRHRRKRASKKDDDLLQVGICIISIKKKKG
jgi:hypothetical protein